MKPPVPSIDPASVDDGLSVTFARTREAARAARLDLWERRPEQPERGAHARWQCERRRNHSDQRAARRVHTAQGLRARALLRLSAHPRPTIVRTTLSTACATIARARTRRRRARRAPITLCGILVIDCRGGTHALGERAQPRARVRSERGRARARRVDAEPPRACPSSWYLTTTQPRCNHLL